ncbi:MAG: putative anti-sigma regulatory factor, serine/threonine protein kinase [Frankiales bacterium]|nr:putative anti-sigma regulatory factor, serine/threonine protein kinase [Frankiales bacterium]
MSSEGPPGSGPGGAVGTRLLRADAQPSWLDEVHALLDELWLLVPDVGATDRMCFTTALAEVAANIVEHAARAGVVPVRLVVQCAAARLSALFEDHGEPYSGAEGSDVEALAESGRGLEMARMLTDELLYERDGPVNRWLVTRACSAC